MGLHFLAFWLCGPSFPCILALWAFISLHFGLFGVSFWAPPPQVAKNGPFAQRPYNGFISAVTGSILRFLTFWAFISLHFGLVGLHFLAFWLCGPSFPCILALWAFISLHFGLVGFHFLAFWLFLGVSGCTMAISGCFLAISGCFWVFPGYFWVFPGYFWVFLGVSWLFLGLSWLFLGVSGSNFKRQNVFGT